MAAGRVWVGFQTILPMPPIDCGSHCPPADIDLILQAE